MSKEKIIYVQLPPVNYKELAETYFDEKSMLSQKCKKLEREVSDLNQRLHSVNHAIKAGRYNR